MANLHSRRIRGNVAFYDTHRKRLLDAIGPDVIKYELKPGDFQANGVTGTDPYGWVTTVTEVGAGTSEVAGASLAGYLATVTTAANENDGLSMQLGGTSFELTSDQDLYLGLEMRINDVDQTDFFYGLAVLDTAILGGVTDRMGFESLDGSADVGFLVEKNSTETKQSSLATMTDNGLIFLEAYWDGSTLASFIDGAEQAAIATTNLPDDVAMLYSLEFLTGEATANNMDIRQMRIIQIGR